MKSLKHVQCVVLGCVVSTVLAVGSWAEDVRKTKSEYKPAYPELAKRMRITGAVKLEVDVNPGGQVVNAKLIGGHPVLAQAALDAIKKWRFEAGPATTTQTVEFNFTNPAGQ